MLIAITSASDCSHTFLQLGCFCLGYQFCTYVQEVIMHLIVGRALPLYFPK